MLPAFNSHGLLPPFHRGSPASGEMSPYPITITDLVTRFGQTPQRTTLLHGLLDYRAALRKAGIWEATQWIDGSFVEQNDIPADIDVVTIFTLNEEQEFCIVDENPTLFDSQSAREQYHVEGYYVNRNSESWLKWVSYYLGLFSHQRGVPHRWKGMLQIELATEMDDQAARLLLNRSGTPRHGDTNPAAEVP